MLLTALPRRPLPTLDAGATAAEAARRLRDSERGCLLVLDAGVPFGMLTERDLVRRVVAEGKDARTRVRDVCSRPLVTIDEAASVHAAADLMRASKVRHLVVVGRGRVAGVVSAADIARGLPEIARHLSARWANVWAD